MRSDHYLRQEAKLKHMAQYLRVLAESTSSNCNLGPNYRDVLNRAANVIESLPPTGEYAKVALRMNYK
jgi:hypothetical protein